MSLSFETLAAARTYTDDSLAGAGALAGVPCQIQSITAITGGNRVTFLWTDNNGVDHTSTMDVMNGVDGEDGKGIQSVSVNAENHLIITYTDGTTVDSGQIEIHSAVDSVNGKTGDVTLDAEDVGALPNNTPIPTKTSDLTNDSGFITSADVPTKTSDLTNDSGFITKAVNDLVNYYLKSETYSKTEVDDIVTAIKNSRFEVVATLPTTDIKTNVIYLVPKSPSQTSNVKDEYINLDGTTAGWEKIGDTEIDLSDYVTTQALNTALAAYTTTSDLTTLLAAKQDTLTFDDAPTENSNNPVKSGGVFTSEQDIYEVMGQNGAKNLLENGYESRTHNGNVFVVNADGTVTVNTQTASSSAAYIENPVFTLGAGTYIYSGCPIGGADDTYRMTIVNATQQTAFVKEHGEGAEFTLTQDTALKCYIEIRPNTSVSNITFKPMIRLASDTDSTYQPYAKTNKQLSEDSVDWDSESRLGAVNYCPYKQGSDTNNNVSISTDENGVVSVSASAAASANTYYYLDVASKYGDISGFVLPAGTYKLKVDAENASLENYDIQLINVTDGGTLIINTITSAVFTIAAGKTIRARVRVKSGQTPSSVKFYPMITLIDYNGPYVPYAKTNRALTVDSLGLNDFCKLGAVNLLENTGVSTTTIRDVIFTKNADGSVTANGTQDGTGGGSYYHVSDTFTCDSGTYKLTGCPSGGSSSTYRLYVYDHTAGSTGEVVNASDTGEGTIFNLQSGHEYNINIMIGVSQTANDMLFKPMITPILDYNGPYVPYAKSNKQLTEDSVTWDDLSEVGAVNELVYPYSETTHTSSNITYTDNGDGSITVGTGTTSSGSPGSYVMANNTKDIQRLRGKTVKFLIDCDTVINGNNANVQMAIYDSSNNLLYNYYLHMNGGRDETILTVPSNADHVYIHAWNKRDTTISTAYTVKPMIAPVDYNGPYVPYAKTNKELTDFVSDVETLTDTTQIAVTDSSVLEITGVNLTRKGNVLCGLIMIKCKTDLPYNTTLFTLPTGFRPSAFCNIVGVENTTNDSGVNMFGLWSSGGVQLMCGIASASKYYRLQISGII